MKKALRDRNTSERSLVPLSLSLSSRSLSHSLSLSLSLSLAFSALLTYLIRYYMFRTDEPNLLRLQNLGPEKWLNFVRSRISKWEVPLTGLIESVSAFSSELELRGGYQHKPADLRPMCSRVVEGDHKLALPRVAFVGDAALTLPPLGGIGANAAIEDGFETGQLLSQAVLESPYDWQSAIEKSNRGIVERSLENLKYCQYSTRSQLPRKPIHGTIRNLLLPWMGKMSKSMI
jgi:2-polyprenyl-6-methoxyphenol hydroxylase-like FAD-dependent oxidoreductase